MGLFCTQGQLIGIMGKVGSGKSLLLDGILAEITKASGIISVNDDNRGFGYVKQNPWLQRGTIRDNILFGKPYDHNKYRWVSSVSKLSRRILLYSLCNIVNTNLIYLARM